MRSARLPAALRLLLCGSVLLAPMAAQAAVRVDIEGIEGEARRNVDAFLSVERYKARDDLDADTIARLYNRITDEVRSALKPLGWYEPTVEASYEAQGSNSWRFRIVINTGKPVLINVAQVRVEGEGADDPVFTNALAAITLQPGQQLNHGNYEQVKGDLLRNAEANGYFDAVLLRNELRVDTTKRSADVQLQLKTGPRYKFGKLAIDQSVIRPELMQRFVRFHEGEPYTSNQLLRTLFALDDSLYFSNVEVLPLLQERDTQALTVPVRIETKKGRRQFQLGGGYGNDTGPRGTFIWSDPRINDRGHRLRVEVKASTITQSFDARYDIPIGDPATERMSVQLTQRNDTSGDLRTQELSLKPSITQLTGTWQRVLSVAATHTRTDSGSSRQTGNLLVPGISFASVPEGYLGEALFSRGFYADLIGAAHVLGSDSDFLRLHLQTERVFDLRPRWHLLLRGEVGTSWARDFDSLPGIYRFFAGGDRSVRGFGYNTLSPTQSVTDANGNTQELAVGGRHLLAGSVEIVRDLPRNLAVAAFFDGGNAFNHFGEPLAYAAGIGVRYRLPVVSIGIDVAQPLSQSGSPRFNINISPKL